MRTLASFVAIIGFAAVAKAQAPAAGIKAGRCANTTTQAELTECFTRSAQAADAKVKQAYQRVMAGSKGKRRELLRTSQRSWLSYRDSYCRYDAAQYEGGSLYASELGACLAERSDARTEELLSDASAERETGGAAPRDH